MDLLINSDNNTKNQSLPKKFSAKKFSEKNLIYQIL